MLGRGFLKLSDFTALLDQNPEISRVELSNYGEPFLHPDLPAILRAAYERRVMLTLNNGANLNNARGEVLEALVRYRLASMTVSIDGATSETYRKYRVGGDLSVVLANVRAINGHKARYRCSRPELRWQFIIFDHNVDEIAQAHAMAAELGMQFVLKLGWGDMALLESPEHADLARREMSQGAASREEYRERHGANYMDGVCHQLWDAPQINWDGKVLGCCRNFWGEFGQNAFADGLLPAVNSERMTYAREMLRGRTAARDDVPCTTCEIYLDRRKAGRWVRRGTGETLTSPAGKRCD